VKLVIEINTLVKKAGGQMNTIQTGRKIALGDLRADMGDEGVSVIEGSLPEM
jgi:hypothetical protein